MLPRKLLTKLLATAYLSLATGTVFATDPSIAIPPPVFTPPANIRLNSKGNIGIKDAALPNNTIISGTRDGSGGPSFVNGDSIITALAEASHIYTPDAIITNILGGMNIQDFDTSGNIANMPLATEICTYASTTVQGRIGRFYNIKINGGIFTMKPQGIQGLISANTNIAFGIAFVYPDPTNTPASASSISQFVIDSTQASGPIEIFNGEAFYDFGTSLLSFVTDSGKDISYTGGILNGSSGKKFDQVTTDGTGNVMFSNTTNSIYPDAQKVSINRATFGAKTTTINNSTINIDDATLKTGSTIDFSNGGQTQLSLGRLTVDTQNALDATPAVLKLPSKATTITSINVPASTQLNIGGNLTILNPIIFSRSTSSSYSYLDANATLSVLTGSTLSAQGTLSNLTLTGGIANFTGNSTITKLIAAKETKDVKSQVTTSAGITVNMTDVEVQSGAILDITGNITNGLSLTDATVNFTGSNNAVKNITVSGSSVLTGTYKALTATSANALAAKAAGGGGDGMWLVKQGGTLQVSDLNGATLFAFEQGSSIGSLIVDGDADFSAVGEFGVASKNSKEIVIKNSTGDRQVTIGKSLIHTGLIRPDADGKHNVKISANPDTFTQLGTASHQFKLINIADPISIDASMINAKALSVENGELTITAGTLGIPTTMGGAAILTINPGAKLTSAVTAASDGMGNLIFEGSGPDAATTALPAIGESAKNIGILYLAGAHVVVGTGNMYVKALGMINSHIELGTKTVAIGNLALTGENTITTTVSGASCGKLTITDGSINTIASGAKLNFVISSKSHIPGGTILTVLDGKLNGLSIAGVTAPDQNTPSVDKINVGQIVFSADLPLSVVTPISSGSILVQTDQGKLDALVNNVGEIDPNAADPVKQLTGMIDTAPGAASPLEQLAAAQTPEEITDIASSFYDPSETISDLDLNSTLNDPGHKAADATTLLAASSGDRDHNAHFWTKVLAGGAMQRLDSDQSSYKQSMRGVLIGIDHDFSERLNMGLALGLSKSDLNYTGKKLGDSLSARGTGLYGFSTYHFNDKVFMNSILSYNHNTIGSKRIRVLSPTQDSLAVAEHISRTYSGTAKIGYKAQLSPIYTITPTVGLIHNYTKDDAYTETGAGGWNFISDMNSRSKTTLVAGVSLAADHETWKPELHLNLYQTLNERKDKVSFGFEWMQTGQRFSNDGPKLPTTQINAGFNLGINPTDGVYTEIIDELNFSRNRIAYQGALSIKIDF